ncbi:MAG: hypothetical protein V3T58_01715 [Candidatus Hydrothermarchaeales archaeon]
MEFRYSVAFVILIPTLIFGLMYYASLPPGVQGDVGRAVERPIILEAAVEPFKVLPGDTMLVTAEVADDVGIAGVMADMGGIESIDLVLVNGTIHRGVWRGEWFVHDTEVREYNATITAVNILGESTSQNVAWSDPIENLSATVETLYVLTSQMSITGCTLTTERESHGPSDNISASVDGKWVSAGCRWEFEMDNATLTDNTFVSANITIRHYASSGYDNDIALLQYSMDGGLNWDILETFNSSNPIPLTPITKTYAAPLITSWEHVSNTIVRLVAEEKTGGVDTWTWYVDFIKLDVNFSQTAPLAKRVFHVHDGQVSSNLTSGSGKGHARSAIIVWNRNDTSMSFTNISDTYRDPIINSLNGSSPLGATLSGNKTVAWASQSISAKNLSVFSYYWYRTTTSYPGGNVTTNATDDEGSGKRIYGDINTSAGPAANIITQIQDNISMRWDYGVWNVIQNKTRNFSIRLATWQCSASLSTSTTPVLWVRVPGGWSNVSGAGWTIFGSVDEGWTLSRRDMPDAFNDTSCGNGAYSTDWNFTATSPSVSEATPYVFDTRLDYTDSNSRIHHTVGEHLVQVVIDAEKPTFDGNTAINTTVAGSGGVVKLNETVNDNVGVESVWFTVNGTNYTFNGSSGNEYYLLWTCSANENYSWSAIYAKDYADNFNSATVDPALNWTCDLTPPTVANTSVDLTSVPRDTLICVNHTANDTWGSLNETWVMITYPGAENTSNFTTSDTGPYCAGEADDGWYGTEINVGNTPGNLTVNTSYANDTVANLGFQTPFPNLTVEVIGVMVPSIRVYREQPTYVGPDKNMSIRFFIWNDLNATRGTDSTTLIEDYDDAWSGIDPCCGGTDNGTHVIWNLGSLGIDDVTTVYYNITANTEQGTFSAYTNYTYGVNWNETTPDSYNTSVSSGGAYFDAELDLIAGGMLDRTISNGTNYTARITLKNIGNASTDYYMVQYYWIFNKSGWNVSVLSGCDQSKVFDYNSSHKALECNITSRINPGESVSFTFNVNSTALGHTEAVISNATYDPPVASEASVGEPSLDHGDMKIKVVSTGLEIDGGRGKPFNSVFILLLAVFLLFSVTLGIIDRGDAEFSYGVVFAILVPTIVFGFMYYSLDSGVQGEVGRAVERPIIVEAGVEPVKVLPGDTMLVTAEVIDDVGIAGVTADMGGIESIVLALVNGTINRGVWRGEWLVHDTEVRGYNATITAVNILGESTSQNVAWLDTPDPPEVFHIHDNYFDNDVNPPRGGGAGNGFFRVIILLWNNNSGSTTYTNINDTYTYPTRDLIDALVNSSPTAQRIPSSVYWTSQQYTVSAKNFSLFRYDWQMKRRPEPSAESIEASATDNGGESTTVSYGNIIAPGGPAAYIITQINGSEQGFGYGVWDVMGGSSRDYSIRLESPVCTSALDTSACTPDLTVRIPGVWNITDWPGWAKTGSEINGWTLTRTDMPNGFNDSVCGSPSQYSTDSGLGWTPTDWSFTAIAPSPPTTSRYVFNTTLQYCDDQTQTHDTVGEHLVQVAPDTEAPSFGNQAGVNATIAGSNKVVKLNESVSDNVGVESVLFTVNDYNYTFNGSSGSEFYLLWTCSANENYSWSAIYAIDSSNNLNGSISGLPLNWTCDVTAPSVGNTSVDLTNAFAGTVVCVNHTASDIGGSLNETWVMITYPNGDTSNRNTNDTGVWCAGEADDGWYGKEINVGGSEGNLTVNTSYANDTAGNLGVQTPFPNLTIEVVGDAEAPTFGNDPGRNATIVGNGSVVKLNETVNDTGVGVDIVLFTVNGTNYTYTNSSGDEFYLLWTCNDNSNYSWSAIYANDSAGNLNGSISGLPLNWTCDVTPPTVGNTSVNATSVLADSVVCVNHTASDIGGVLNETWVMITDQNGDTSNVLTNDTGVWCAGGVGDGWYGEEINVGGSEGNLTVNTSYANDSAGNLGVDPAFPNLTVEVTVEEDNEAPTFGNVTGVNVTIAGSGGVVKLNETVSDNVGVNVTLFTVNGFNYTANSSDGEKYLLWNCNDNATYSWTVIYANDSEGNANSSTSGLPLNWTCDLTPPTVGNTSINVTSVLAGSVICVNHTANDTWGVLNETWVMITYPDGSVDNVSTNDTGVSCADTADDNWYGAEINVGNTPGNLTVNTSYANDTAGNLGVQIPSPNKTVTVIDNQIPWYTADSDNSNGLVTNDTMVNVSVYWQDAGGLDTAILRTNESGTWKNISSVNLSGTDAWANFTINTSNATGNTTCWNQYANDNSNNLNTSMLTTEHCFYVVNAPKGYYIYTSENFFVRVRYRPPTWGSYNDSTHQTLEEIFYNDTTAPVGDRHNVYMYGENYRVNTQYEVIYYYPDGDLVATQYSTSNADGELLDVFDADGYEAGINYTSAVCLSGCPAPYNVDDSDIIAVDIFEVQDALVLPEFGYVLIPLLTSGAAYLWLRRRFKGEQA